MPAAPVWDPTTYLAHADERGRPFVELLSRVRAEDPRTVVDLGCGPGNLTALLAGRWPDARVRGVDASEEMVARARRDHPDLEVDRGDLRDWSPQEPVDVLISHATLQWVPGHLDLLPGLLDAVAPGGWLALQVPGNLGEPSHELRRSLAATAPYADHTGDLAEIHSHDAVTYLEVLVALGCSVDAWETTYLHVLHGEDPVFRWVSGTGARPTLQALEAVGLRERFEEELKTALRAAYPETGHGVVLPFRRVFAVAQVPA